MKKVFVIALFVSIISVARSANATIDIMATVQSAIESKTEILTKIEAIAKKGMDAYKRGVQGFQAASNCMANPLKCNLRDLGAAVSDISSITGIRTLPGVEELSSGNLKKKDAKDLDSAIIENYTYEKGKKDSINETTKKRKELNAVMADEVAILFAKGVVVRESIRREKSDEVYSNDIGASQSDILAVHNNLTLKSLERLSRILELRAYMIGAEATAELARNTASQEEMKEQLDN